MRWRSFIVLAVIVAFIAVAPALFGTFTITLMNYIGIYAIAALGLVLLTGVGGLTSFGQAAFVGIGAYATAWYTAVQGGSPWIGLALGLALTGVVAALLGAATLRLGGHFLPLSTIAWGIAIYFVFGNLDALNRYSGLSGIPPISLGPSGARRHRLDLLLHLGRGRRSDAALSQPAGFATGARRSAACAAVSPWSRASPSTSSARGSRCSCWRACSPACPAGCTPTCSASSNPNPFDIRPGIELLFMALVGGTGQIAGAVVGSAIVDPAQELSAGCAAVDHPLQRADGSSCCSASCSLCCCRRRAVAWCR